MRTQTRDDNTRSLPLEGFHVEFSLTQRGPQVVGYEPPNWIAKDRRAKEYLLRQTADHLDHQHPYALEQYLD